MKNKNYNKSELLEERKSWIAVPDLVLRFIENIGGGRLSTYNIGRLEDGDAKPTILAYEHSSIVDGRHFLMSQKDYDYLTKK